jgi:tetratricopeptide (TPR) repeat protein
MEKDATAVKTVLRARLGGVIVGTVLGVAATVSARQAPAPDDLRATTLKRAATHDCLPIVADLEALHHARPDDAEVTASLSECLILHAATLPTQAERKAERARARQLAVEAWERGDHRSFLRTTIEWMPPDGGTGEDVVADPAARQRFVEGQAAFARQDYAAAAAAYRDVLAIEPANYLAALFLGDVGFTTGRHDEAARWFSRAIEIDPDLETAYRYWADDLTNQGRLDEARDKYIDAFVADPYNSLTASSLESWAERTNHLLLHPAIVAWHVEDLNPDRLDDTGVGAWPQYYEERAEWRDHKFRSAHPAETAYRRSLAEERASFERVIADVRARQSRGTIRTLDIGLKMLLRISDDGLLDAFILLTIPEVAPDYAAYRKDHRAELVRYVREWMLQERPSEKPPVSDVAPVIA